LDHTPSAPASEPSRVARHADASPDVEGRRRTRSGSPLVLRILGVAAAAALGIGTFATLGLAVAQSLYDRGMIGRKGSEEMEALGYLVSGVIAGAAIGLVVAVWVGLRVWQSRWALLLILLGVTVLAAVTLTIAAS
jgi:hypothetical protein